MKMVLEFKQHELIDMIRGYLRREQLIGHGMDAAIVFMSASGAPLSGIVVSAEIAEVPTASLFER